MPILFVLPPILLKDQVSLSFSSNFKFVILDLKGQKRQAGYQEVAVNVKLNPPSLSYTPFTVFCTVLLLGERYTSSLLQRSFYELPYRYYGLQH